MTSIRSLEHRIGEEVGVSPWVEVSQERIDTFARAIDDFQWIHVDRERARGSPFGTTIAHGYLTLSLIPSLGGGGLKLHTHLHDSSSGPPYQWRGS
jgi:acyl dehydratase